MERKAKWMSLSLKCMARSGQVNIKSSSFLETDNLSAEVMPAFEREYSPQQLDLKPATPHLDHPPSQDRLL